MKRIPLPCGSGLRLLALTLALIPWLAGCGSDAAKALESAESRPVDDTIRITGFYADLMEGNKLMRRVMAEHAVYAPMAREAALGDWIIPLGRPSPLFILDNVHVEFFDADSSKPVDELFADYAIWYVADLPRDILRFDDARPAPKNWRPGMEALPVETTAVDDTDTTPPWETLIPVIPSTDPELARAANDLDMHGHVLYRVIENKDALSTERLLHDATTGEMRSDAPFIKILMKEDSMTVFKGAGFKTDREFANWSYTKASIESEPYSDEKYREYIPGPPSNAPDYKQYEQK